MNNISSKEALRLISQAIKEFISNYTTSNKVKKVVNGNDCTIQVTRVDFQTTTTKHWNDQEGKINSFYLDIGHPNVAAEPNITISTRVNQTGTLKIKATKTRDNTSEIISRDFYIDGLELEYNSEKHAFIIKGDDPFSKIIF
ncbi:hypothetical protein [Aureispira sp. CCB-E]|uniref:hypothetical protein n=1 Tax=Aureispira sp. CCB-E TaxID=3051121 RepID=UPI0028693DD0|nr:hypothetical protein [Aureispira sp. CCB-E]WMX14916.1 hypothetical protein QP953_00865 [Aureispira sp. CCB-E]